MTQRPVTPPWDTKQTPQSSRLWPLLWVVVCGLAAAAIAAALLQGGGAPLDDAVQGPAHAAAATPSKAHPTALPGAREPSGALALPGKGVILVVDDEPKRAPHKLGLFVYRPKADKLQHLPLRWPARHKRRWDDWEGIAADARHIVLMTSHAKRKGKRARLCRFPRKALVIGARHATLTSRLTCIGGKRQRKAIKRLIDAAATQRGFTLAQGWRSKGPKRGGLDLEGLVYDPANKRFLIGLRGPLMERSGVRYAIFLAMTWGAGNPQFSVVGAMDFGGRGVRAITRLHDGSFLINAGPVGNKGTFALYRLAKGWPAQAFAIQRPGGLAIAAARLHKVEGLAAWGKTIFLFHDEGDWRGGQPARATTLSRRQVMR